MKKNNILRIALDTISNSFFKATVWVFIGTGVMNIGNYLFHLLMGRLLGPIEYGVIESVIAFSYLLSVPLMTLNLIIVKHISSYKGNNDYESIASFYNFIKRLFLRQGLFLCIILVLVSPFITSFLHLSSNILSILLVAFVFVGLFSGLGKGTLQGMSNFFGMAIVNTVEAVTKITIAVILVVAGLKSQGGLFGIVVASALAYGASTLFLKQITKQKIKPFADKHLVGKYTIPTFLTTLSITSLFSTDILLARHFLGPQQAGFYAALSILGKVVFFAVSPVSLVMFPFISERNARGEKYTRILFGSLGLTIVGSACVVILYYLFPDIVVSLLFGKSFVRIASYVWLFGVFIAIYSVCYLLANFFLSIRKTIPSYLIAGAAILQIIGIYLFHNGISEIIMVSIIITFLLLISLLLYYASEIRSK